MNKREINLSDKKLYTTTKEEVIFKSPFRIPPKGVQDLIQLKGITPSEVAYYDISPTEHQSIGYRDQVTVVLSSDALYDLKDLKEIIGQFSDI